MKKLLSMALIVAASILLLTGCGSKSSKSEETKETIRTEISSLGNKAIKISEDYLNSKIESEEAFIQLYDMTKEIDNLGEVNQKEDTTKLYILELSNWIAMDEDAHNSEKTNDIKESIKNLKSTME